MKIQTDLPANLSFRPKAETYAIVKQANTIGLNNSDFFHELVRRYGPTLIEEMAHERRAQLEDQLAILNKLTAPKSRATKRAK